MEGDWLKSWKFLAHDFCTFLLCWEVDGGILRVDLRGWADRWEIKLEWKILGSLMIESVRRSYGPRQVLSTTDTLLLVKGWTVELRKRLGRGDLVSWALITCQTDSERQAEVGMACYEEVVAR
jgi:hypothetical protein